MIIGPGITIGQGIYVDSNAPAASSGGIVTSGLQFNLATAPSTGSTWTDSSGNGRNATLVGSPSYVSINGGGIRLNNPDNSGTDYISVPYNIASNTVTVEVVASFNPTSFWGSIWGNEIFDTSGGYVAYVDGSTNISYGIPYGETAVTITESNDIRQWIFVINGTQASLFLNGSQVGTTGTISNQTLFATSEFYFGARHLNDGTGSLDVMNNAAFYPVFYQMRVYNKALSGAEITQNYNAVKDTYGLEPTIVTSGLQLYLDAGNASSYPGTGTEWTDLSGNGRNGTLTNGPTYSSAGGGSIVFDGTNDFVQCSGSVTTTAATFVAWIRRNGTQGSYDGILFSRGSNVTGMQFQSSNQLSYMWNGAVNTYTWQSGLIIPDLTWCMVAVSVTSTSATAYLCQSSGITSATNTVSHTSTILNDIKIGQEDFGGRFFNGSIAITQLYNTALSAAEITQNFQADRARFGI
jgi:hypothetical protein